MILLFGLEKESLNCRGSGILQCETAKESPNLSKPFPRFCLPKGPLVLPIYDGLLRFG